MNTKTEIDICDIAYEYSLDIIETTTGRNGYPQELKYAIIGFSDFQEAQSIAEKYGLRITTFFKKEGWQLWQRDKNTTFKPMHITSENYGDNYKHFYCSDYRTFFEDEVKPRLENFDDFDSLEKFVLNQREILDKIDSIDDSQLVITRNLEYYETIDIQSMSWNHDGNYYEIGVIKD